MEANQLYSKAKKAYAENMKRLAAWKEERAKKLKELEEDSEAAYEASRMLRVYGSLIYS